MKQDQLKSIIVEEVKSLLSEIGAPERKMKDAVLQLIHAHLTEITNWVVEGDSQSFGKFFEQLQKTVSKKYADYVDPESFTATEKELLQKFELLKKTNLNINNDFIRYNSNVGVLTLYKFTYADNKRMAYILDKNGKSIKSKPFDIKKKQSIRELANVLKSMAKFIDKDKLGDGK